MAFIKYEILYEDADILVCYKPAGLAVQTKRLGQQDLETQLKNYLVRKKEKPYVGVVHRLDQPVEGVMVFGKNPKATAGLSRQVQSREIGKYYYAVGCRQGVDVESTLGDRGQTASASCENKIPEEKGTLSAEGTLPEYGSLQAKGTLSDYLIFDQRTNTGAVVEKENPDAKKAVLDYQVIGQGKADGKVCFDIHLHTGRHHQIRLQMAHLGYPLVGDTKYGGAVAGQLALCSYRICFEHPTTKEKMDFVVKPRNLEFSEYDGNFH